MNETVKEYIAKNNLTYFIETYGCQMNSHESEKLAGVLSSLGFAASPDKRSADLVLFNTCCIREHAEARLYGNVGALKDLKEENKNAVIGVCGCMMQQTGAARKLLNRFHFVDMAFGTNHVHHMEHMLHDVLLGGKRALMADEDSTIVEGLPAVRGSITSAFVNIIYGCNNFCTYCIVPFVRGRERSRKPDEILNEINMLTEQGVSEITLLGQNVNSYGTDKEGCPTFAGLLEQIDRDTDIKRLRFMTSHPKDMTDELIECFGKLGSLCEHIHLPVQSGSDRILSLMNRRYTRARYLGLVEKLRQRVPDIAITTDIIVGFPGETEADFSDTLSLARQVGYDAAYTFAYSPRPLTKAADMTDQLSREEKSERLARLNKLIAASVIQKNNAYLNQTVEVLVENASKRDDGEISGKTRSAKTVNFEGSENEIGHFVSVKIDSVKNHTLHGVR